jgi:hypothetical protein
MYGLPEGLVASHGLRTRKGDSIQELLWSQGRTVGLPDCRVTMGNIVSARRQRTDPSFFLVRGPFLAEAVNLDNSIRVFDAAGYYDPATPYASQEYVLDPLALPTNLCANITLRHYHAGHQIYTSTNALRQLTSDVRAFMIGFDARE